MKKFKEIFDEILQQTTQTMCVHMAKEADVKAREKVFEFFYKYLGGPAYGY